MHATAGPALAHGPLVPSSQSPLLPDSPIPSALGPPFPVHSPLFRLLHLSLLLALSLHSPLGAQGLISTMADLNVKGDPASGGTKAAAAVADVVTAPVQLPLYLFAKARSEREKAAHAQVMEQITRIRQDPDYIFQHRLHLAEGHKGLTALIHSLHDPAVPFTDAQLRRLHRELGFWGWRVFPHPACSREFLAEAWQHYCATESKFDPVILQHFSLNPNLPDEWLETVARGEAKATSLGCQHEARLALLRRQAERPAQLTAAAATP